MPRKPRIYPESGYMHVISRGVAKQTIFEDEGDYKFFVKQIRENSEKADVSIIAYCLMSNHFHILLHTKGVEVSQFVQILCTTYSMYYNRKYARVGHLFQDRYHSEVITDEAYFMTAFRYIVRNPEKAGICKTENYKWHSLYRNDSVNKFVDLTLPISIAGGVEQLRKYVLTPNDDAGMEYDSAAVTDDEAVRLIKETCHVAGCKDIMKMNKEDMRAAVQHLLKNGLSQRQLSRVVGITRYQLKKLLS